MWVQLQVATISIFLAEDHDNMTPAYIALLIGALSASWVSRENLRGILWIVASQIAFWLPVLYWDFSLPLPMLFVAICDATIVYALYKYGEERWEEWLMIIYLFSILTSFSAQAITLMDQTFNIYAYSWSLYILNWLAVFLVGTTSGLRRVDRDRSSLAFANWSFVFGRSRTMARKEEE